MKPYHIKVGKSYSAWVNLEDILAIYDVEITEIPKSRLLMYKDIDFVTLNASALFRIEFKFKDTPTSIDIQASHLVGEQQEYEVANAVSELLLDL